MHPPPLQIYGTLGHPSFSKMSMLNKFVPFVSTNKSQCCDIYHFAKQKKLSFPTSEHVSIFPFDLVHCDLWGPFFKATNEGYKYFLTIVDDFSRYTWVYLLIHKSETGSLIPQFAAMVETQFGKKLKCIRSDNGTEFYLKDFFQKQWYFASVIMC